MAKALTEPGELTAEISAPKRKGKYDEWLDGRIWELKETDATWFEDWQRVVRGLRDRSRARGIRAAVVRSDDGTVITVQAITYARWKRQNEARVFSQQEGNHA